MSHLRSRPSLKSLFWYPKNLKENDYFSASNLPTFSKNHTVVSNAHAFILSKTPVHVHATRGMCDVSLLCKKVIFWRKEAKTRPKLEQNNVLEPILIKNYGMYEICQISVYFWQKIKKCPDKSTFMILRGSNGHPLRGNKYNLELGGIRFTNHLR